MAKLECSLDWMALTDHSDGMGAINMVRDGNPEFMPDTNARRWGEIMDPRDEQATMSLPVPGTLMIEPTESESKHELDRFIEAMLSIRAEIAKVQEGQWPAEDNPLKGAPHTLADVIGVWQRPYSIEQAVSPTSHTRLHKYWPTANRIDNVYGDRNLFCACVPLSEYQ